MVWYSKKNSVVDGAKDFELPFSSALFDQRNIIFFLELVSFLISLIFNGKVLQK